MDTDHTSDSSDSSDPSDPSAHSVLATATPTPTSTRRRHAVTAAITSVVLVGGVIAGTQFASADEPTLEPDDTDEPAVEAADTSDVDGHDETDPTDADEHDEAWAAHEACMGEQLGIDLGGDEPTDAELDALDAITDERWDAADAACDSLLPEEILAELAAFEEYEQCLDEQLGELGIEFVDEPYHGSVVVEGVDDVEFFDFGDGDGTVTITKVGDAITTSTDGDVTVVDLDALDAEWEEHEAAWDQAHEACESLLPEDAFIDDLFDEDVDDEFDDEFDDELPEDDSDDDAFDDVTEPAAG